MVPAGPANSQLFFPKSVAQKNHLPAEIYSQIVSYVTGPDIIALWSICKESADATKEPEIDRQYQFLRTGFWTERALRREAALNSNFGICQGNELVAPYIIDVLPRFRNEILADFATKSSIKDLSNYVIEKEAGLIAAQNLMKFSVVEMGPSGKIDCTSEKLVIDFQLALLSLEYVLKCCDHHDDQSKSILKAFLQDSSVTARLDLMGFRRMCEKMGNEYHLHNGYFSLKHSVEYAVVEFSSCKPLAWTLTCKRHQNDVEQLEDWFFSKFNLLDRMKEMVNYERGQSGRFDHLPKKNDLVFMDFTPPPLPDLRNDCRIT